MENVIGILFCLSLFVVALTFRVRAYVSVLRAQGLLLAILLLIPVLSHPSLAGFILPATLLIVKVWLIPHSIDRVILNLDISRRVEPTIQPMIFLPIVITSMIVIIFATNILAANTELDIIPFASGIFAIVVGIYLVLFRKKLIIHVCGFLIMENGIFLIGYAVASELPMIIELGILLDVFVVVFLMGIALNKIRNTFEGFDVTHLGRLKD